jgi:hypothetical protein
MSNQRRDGVTWMVMVVHDVGVHRLSGQSHENISIAYITLTRANAHPLPEGEGFVTI